MGRETPGVNVDSLWRVERIYRNRLADEPSDMVARTGLAWCLFLQALHRAGEESTLEAIVAAAGGALRESAHDRDSRALLQDSMLNAATVLQLSPCGRERLDVERLQMLVELSGGLAAVAAARESAHEILGQIALELNTSATRPRVRRRRKTRRPDAEPTV
ncbi:MAG: hypothetical protein ACO1SX_04690 [Actinomycetota bacterium]